LILIRRNGGQASLFQPDRYLGDSQFAGRGWLRICSTV
jgi:hypothetical protein